LHLSDGFHYTEERSVCQALFLIFSQEIFMNSLFRSPSFLSA